ncbi:MAG TPA: MOSC domain-containing protein [Acidimicrobiia bacterium]|jgi:MOSC domain-containing protein YiiM
MVDYGNAPEHGERCDECRFDGAAYTDLDVAGTLRAIAPWWQLLVRNLDDDVLQQRPAPGVWSAVEYAEHSTMVTSVIAMGLAALLEHDGVDLGAVPGDPAMSDTPSTSPMANALSTLEREVDAYADLAAKSLVEPDRFLVLDGDRYRAGWLVRHGLHDALHHLQDVGRGLHALGAGTPSHAGTVVQINVSDGGVPKRPVDAVAVGYRGLEHDRQRSRRHHGRVWQALCLYSTEAIARFQAEGHPIEWGSAGENFTVEGIDWAAVRPGTRLRIGDVLAEISLPALPCGHNARWFTDGDFNHMHHERDYTRTRWYARVLEDGTVRTGDKVLVEPT